MKKYERIYREILIGVLNKKERFSQLELSKKCYVSLGLVNKILKRLKEMGAVEIFPMQFRVIDASKILFEWATNRSINKEISEKYCINLETTEIEKSSPFILTAYSAWRLASKSVPFEYSNVYIYVSKEQKEFLKTWLKDKPLIKGKENVFVLITEDKHLIENSKGKIASIPQIFVDIYSLWGMESKYFITDILEKYPIFRVGVE
ncbi:MAG: winged helix-turn-helix domain-containing protein [Candidatus Pacearchaeota archaeon]|nr:winged helix-turn-helix domain-containing protein [Candidatus Pacearchaeota archaeon]